MIRRVVQFSDFSVCWENDRLAAEGLVAKVRALVKQRDTFTRLADEREAEATQRRLLQAKHQREVAERRSRYQQLRDDLGKLMAMNDAPHERGRAFEVLLAGIFKLDGILVREPFKLSNEQIDGAVYFDAHLYLVEAKWWNRRLEHKDVAGLYMKVAERPRGTRGLFFSASGYTEACIATCTNPALPQVVFVTIEDVLRALENEQAFDEVLRRKVQHAGALNRILVSYKELFD